MFNIKILGLYLFLLLLPLSSKAEQRGAVVAKDYYASFRSAESNVRAGPGQEYPIKFTFKLRGMPIKVIAEYDNWNEIEDFEGETGWVNQNLLTKKRTILIRTARSFVNFHSSPKDKSKIIYRVENNIIGDFIACNLDWCNLKINGKKGWLERSEIWGVEKKQLTEAAKKEQEPTL